MNVTLAVLEAVNAVLWHDAVLLTVLGVGVLFTLWSGLGQYRALTHGVSVISGRYDKKDDPGAINHFQALSAALSATVGLGNIAGVAIAVSLGGPGAVFWMWVVTKGLSGRGPGWQWAGRVIGGIFCVTLLISTVTGGNMFQAWNVADITKEYFGVPIVVTGLVQCALVALVILGGIRRIGAVAGRLVPLMCGLYLVAALFVIWKHFADVPSMLRLIVHSAFNPVEASGAFVGGTAGWAFLRGMQRALFSNEAGQGSAPIAHSAARTDEPVREGIVAGLEPFVDTLCICTITALVILLSGAWNRVPEARFLEPPQVREVEAGEWSFQPTRLAERPDFEWQAGDRVFTIIVGESHAVRETAYHRLYGTVDVDETGASVTWDSLASPTAPRLGRDGVYEEYKGATLTAKAFDRVLPGLGFWIVPSVVWLFAFSTMISWSYYGEQGAVYLFGERSITPYRVLYCLLVLAACTPLIRTEAELDMISTLGTGVMLFANIPIMLLFGRQAMRAYHDYLRRLDDGELTPVRRV